MDHLTLFGLIAVTAMLSGGVALTQEGADLDVMSALGQKRTFALHQ
jgi:hypothetical protein